MKILKTKDEKEKWVKMKKTIWWKSSLSKWIHKSLWSDWQTLQKTEDELANTTDNADCVDRDFVANSSVERMNWFDIIWFFNMLIWIFLSSKQVDPPEPVLLGFLMVSSICFPFHI